MNYFINYPDSIWRSVFEPVANIFIFKNKALKKYKGSNGYYLEGIPEAYITSFFKTIKTGCICIENGHNPFESGIKLLEMGLIPMNHKDKWILCNYKGIIYREHRPIFNFMNRKRKVKE